MNLQHPLNRGLLSLFEHFHLWTSKNRSSRSSETSSSGRPAHFVWLHRLLKWEVNDFQTLETQEPTDVERSCERFTRLLDREHLDLVPLQRSRKRVIQPKANEFFPNICHKCIFPSAHAFERELRKDQERSAEERATEQAKRTAEKNSAKCRPACLGAGPPRGASSCSRWSRVRLPFSQSASLRHKCYRFEYSSII